MQPGSLYWFLASYQISDSGVFIPQQNYDIYNQLKSFIFANNWTLSRIRFLHQNKICSRLLRLSQWSPRNRSLYFHPSLRNLPNLHLLLGMGFRMGFLNLPPALRWDYKILFNYCHNKFIDIGTAFFQEITFTLTITFRATSQVYTVYADRVNLRVVRIDQFQCL